MKKVSLSVFCFFLLAVALLYALDTKAPKVITIHSVRVMESFKKDNKAHYRKKTEQPAKDTDMPPVSEESNASDSEASPPPESAEPSGSAHTEAPPAANSDGTPHADTSAESHAAHAPTAATPEEAQKAVDEQKDEIIIFTGGVSLSVKDGSTVSTVDADKVVYNRSENTIEATGNVRYSRKTSAAKEQSEEFIGELLLFNIDEMEGIFLDGTIKQAPRKKGENPFTIQSATIGRDASDATGFKNAVLSTNTDIDDDPLWSIRASRIWMLPGNELAIANGYFSIGVVPLFYLPFFYHPADEMIFHPVFGFRNREGYFLQTTTYLLGRKPLDTDTKTQSSFSNFMKSDTLKKQARIGLFLKNLDEEETNTDPPYIKLIADIYSHLGGLVGIDGKIIPQDTPVKQLDFSLLFGMSRTLYPLNNNIGTGITISHTTYDAIGKRHYNNSTFYGKPTPFRYRAHLNFNLSESFGHFSVNMPFISDPFFKKDFLDRSEEMNWFSYLLNRDKLAAGSDIKSENSYSWKINGSIRPSFNRINPWLTAFNLDHLSLKVDFDEKENNKIDPLEGYNAPHHRFFYPKLFKPEGTVSIAGTLLSDTIFAEKKFVKVPEVEGIAHPFKENQLKEAPESDTKNTTEETKEQKPEFLDSFMPVFKPLYGKEFDHSIAYALGYKGNFTALQETTFADSVWKNPEDIKWTDYDTRYYQLHGDAGLKGTFSYSQNLIALSSSFTVSGNYQRHPWVREKKRLPILEFNNFKANIYALKNENSLTVNPFIHNDLFKPVSFSWTISEIIAKNTFIGTYYNPKWKTEKVKWNKDFITSHTGSAAFGIIFAEQYTQKLTFFGNLPPLLQAYGSTINLSFPYAVLTASTKLFEKEKAKKKWFWDPFKMELNWTFPYDIKATQAYIYNIEEKDNERLHMTFGWKYLSAFYTHSRDIPHHLIPGSGWTPKSTEKKFIPFAAGFSFSNTSQPFTLYYWKNRIKIQLGLDTNLYFNLIRITDSYFTFAPKLIFNIHEFWDLSFGSFSRNDVIARYFQKALNLPVIIPGNTNVFTDLMHSFYFWDRAKRESSGFKLQSLDLGLTHYLKDWVLKFNCNITPLQKKSGKQTYYEFSPTITLAVEWNPIKDIKVEAKKKDGTFSFERAKVR